MTTQSTHQPGTADIDNKSEEFAEYRKQLYESASKGQGSEGIVDFFNSVAAKYDKVVSGGGYCGPVNMVAVLADFISNKSSRILDAASGSGIVGEELKRLGYTRVDALEPSAKMLDLARQRQIYAEYICDTLDEHQTVIPNDCYDVVLMCGAFGLPGHVTEACFPELIQITKSGGYIMFTVSKDALDANQGTMEGAIQAMSEKGVWVLMEYRWIPYLINDLKKEMAKVPILKVMKSSK